ncbi:type II toxin-antitoxin system RelE/ParE family toxin [Nitrospirillum sp. BR 11164]|uniref:type II toxin-antitoxin system RelE/ParE family toxin n=1 Tax=Nitrospirillum sp. BR 11164 TaxID=3104324 RepID=UPI002AFECC1E|nr:type II toxin-antitoxin system RelE/ParE family toxin [Nitrospirillum sp. BR 11164]MEA1649175.1 type II toxin-antitoxin system RelE/ParE family toxin [Nitrospirillum sp. BR 11164]
MARVIRTAQAEEDLMDIWIHIAQDNPQAADALLTRIDHACWRLAAYPGMGPARPDLAPGLRYTVVGAYLILYRIAGPNIEVVRVIHGARHLPDIF